MTVLQWLRTRDAGLSALRRAGRAAILMPALFAVSTKIIGDPTFALFAAFGALATLLFIDFTGSVRERLAAQASLVLTGALLICLGTLATHAAWLAAVATLVVGFAVLFIGVVSSVLASATTALLVAFILAVTLPGPVDSIPVRLGGWLLAGAVSLVAVVVLWPAPAREPLRLSTARACALLARRLRAEVDCVRCGFDPETRASRDTLTADARAAVAALRSSFFGTPYRPTGLNTSARMLVRLVDQVIWLDAVLERTPTDERAAPTDAAVCEVKLAAAALLERGTDVLESLGDPAQLTGDLERLREAREAMERTVTSTLPVRHAEVPAGGVPGPGAAGELDRDSDLDDGAARTSVTEFVDSLEPSFRAQEMSFATSAIAQNIELTVAARRRTWWQQILGHRPEGVGSQLSSVQERAGAHVEWHSVWLHNSLRGAIALSLAILVTELTGVQHSFWVVFGTLAVLRSNALNTGQNALRGLLGTVVGFIIGGALVLAIGTNTVAFWCLLPLAIVFAGLAPAAISFAAGQAGFTITLLILYNVIGPAGWKIGLVRIEDVAIGCAVSLLVGALFWPRGAGSALGQALSEALDDGAEYLLRSVRYGLTRCDARVPAAPVPRDEARRAAASARRLDDAFRGFLAERGTKRVSLPDVAALITSVAVLRLTADAVLDLWDPDGTPVQGDRAAARAEILESGMALAGWYKQTGRALAGNGGVPDPILHDTVADGRLLDAVHRDLTGEDGSGTATAVKMIWTADHIDAVRRLQPAILAPARAVVAAQAGAGSRRRTP
ncbi:FUSC family protein [Rugosimonospora africana]|uniref:FUSC family protein n=1 Tax=Rugosimonospora africana TaxID=556532 RepID=A0A8J3QUB3_9ACTN|nr:FUSC family protein [Rugosimonospora africana]GIH16217.1 FUSC family protein [Rugosimonospora africana]